MRMFQTAIPEKISIARKNDVEIRILLDAEDSLLDEL